MSGKFIKKLVGVNWKGIEIFCGYEVGQRNRKFVLQGRPRISLSAAVWKAYKVHSKNVVAVKFCNDRSRFQRQVKILRALSSKVNLTN